MAITSHRETGWSGAPGNAMRERIRARDGYQCTSCGTAEGPFEVDHIIELATILDPIEKKRMAFDEENLRLLCVPCHKAKNHVPKKLIAKVQPQKLPSQRKVDEVIQPEYALNYIPDNAAPPHYMSHRHPEAVGTYGERAAEWLEKNRDVKLRWWQRLCLDRALEYNENGELIWSEIIVSTPRQSGKSVWLREAILLWRIFDSEALLGEPQVCVHVAHKLKSAVEIFAPAARWVQQENLGKVRWANGEQQIDLMNGNRWILESASDGAAVGFSVNCIVVDEAWRVRRDVVDGALRPTMTERMASQIYLVSTAGDSKSDLMEKSRQQAMKELKNPVGTLLIEWSADQWASIDDVNVWKAASPYWSERRHRAIKASFNRMSENEFRQQFLNQWQVNVDGWMSESLWDAGFSTEQLPQNGLIAALETNLEGSFGLTVGGMVKNNLVLRGQEHANIRSAWAHIQNLANRHPDMELLVGASLLPLKPRTLTVEKIKAVGPREGRIGTPLFHRLASDKRIRHDGDANMRLQVLRAQPVRSEAGIYLSSARSDGRIDLVKGMAWIAWAIQRDESIEVSSVF